MSTQANRFQFSTFVFGLSRRLLSLRLDGTAESFSQVTDWLRLGINQGFIDSVQTVLITRLAFNSLQSASPIFPDKRNAGPYMPDSVWIERAKADGVFDRILIDECSEQLPAPASEVDGMTIQSVLGLPGEGMTLEGITQVPAPAPRRELRLLCLLVENGGFSRAYPPQTLRSVPPRVDHFSKWGGSNLPGLFMRETHAIAPAPEVLARLQRHGQTRSLCAAESPRRHCATV